MELDMKEIIEGNTHEENQGSWGDPLAREGMKQGIDNREAAQGYEKPVTLQRVW